MFLVSVIILPGVSVSHGWLFCVCLWLDHYLHQHGGCGLMDAMWLGGIATYTTARDQCVEMVYCSSVIVAGCISLGTSSSGVCFLVIYALSLDAWLSFYMMLDLRHFLISILR